MDPTEELQKLRDHERICIIKLNFKKFFPIQKHERRQKVFLGLVYSGRKQKRTNIRTEESFRPEIRQETAELVERYEDAKVFTFEKNEKGEVVLTDAFGRWGAIHKAMFEYWKSLRKAPYIIQMLESIRVESLENEPPIVVPKYDFGDNPPEKPFSLPVPRSRGATRQIEYCDYLEEKVVSVRIRFPQAVPISKEEFIGLVHGLEFINLGPFRRGDIRVEAIVPVQNWFKGTEARTAEQVVP